jgi:hypothetical protein
MAQETLVDRYIDAGRQLIQDLDQVGFPVVAALWNFLPEEDEWRLLIASPQVNELGPLAAYKAVQEVLLQSPIGLTVLDVSVVGPDEPLITDLRISAGTDPAPFLGGTSLHRTVIGNVYVAKAYVYRAERIIGNSGTFEYWSVTRDKPRKVWIARRCQVIVEGGAIKKIDVEGYDWPQSHARDGINAHLEVLVNQEVRKGKTFGDVQRWTILGGRLRSIETIARSVRVEGYSPSPSSAGAAT